MNDVHSPEFRRFSHRAVDEEDNWIVLELLPCPVRNMIEPFRVGTGGLENYGDGNGTGLRHQHQEVLSTWDAGGKCIHLEELGTDVSAVMMLKPDQNGGLAILFRCLHLSPDQWDVEVSQAHWRRVRPIQLKRFGRYSIAQR